MSAHIHSSVVHNHQKWKHPTCSLTHEQNAVRAESGHDSALKRRETLRHVTTVMNLEDTVRRELSQSHMQILFGSTYGRYWEESSSETGERLVLEPLQ